jgi:hypothetical protein
LARISGNFLCGGGGVQAERKGVPKGLRASPSTDKCGDQAFLNESEAKRRRRNAHILHFLPCASYFNGKRKRDERGGDLSQAAETHTLLHLQNSLFIMWLVVVSFQQKAEIKHQKLPEFKTARYIGR